MKKKKKKETETEKEKRMMMTTTRTRRMRRIDIHLTRMGIRRYGQRAVDKMIHSIA